MLMNVQFFQHIEALETHCCKTLEHLVANAKRAKKKGKTICSWDSNFVPSFTEFAIGLTSI